MKKEAKKESESRFYSWYTEIKSRWKLILLAIFLFIISGIINKLAGSYVDNTNMAAVSDLILDHIPAVWWMKYSYVFGYLGILGLMILYALIKPKYLHEIIFQFSLLGIVRSFFIILTHLKIPEGAISYKFPGLILVLQYSNDCFFSGHTAFAFLGFLVFKGKIRWFFLAASVAMAATVLLGHLHYSIDVFAAFFIAYGVYKFGNLILSKLKK